MFSLQKDTKRKQMSSRPCSKSLLNIAGPKGVPWIVDADFSISARRLYEPQALNAFEKCFEYRSQPIYASYGRRIGMQHPVDKDKYKELCKITRKTLHSGYDKMDVLIDLHKQSLCYLGELSRQCQRAIENGIILKGFVKDIRLTNPIDLKNLLDKWETPAHNVPNLYDFGQPDLHFLTRWLSQDDIQAAMVTSTLVGSKS